MQTPYPESRKIAIVAASRVELAPILRRLGLKRRGSVATGSAFGFPVYAMATGVGGSRSRQKVGQLLRQERIRLLIHVGFAGGLDPTLQPGDLLAIRTVVNEQGIGIELDSAAPHRLLTLDHVADTTAAKAALRQKHQAHAVDMETYYLAKLTAETGTPYLPLRAISDPSDLALPATAHRWIDPDGASSPKAVMGHLMRNPRDVKLLSTLQANSKLAGQVIADAVERKLSEMAGEVGA